MLQGSKQIIILCILILLVIGGVSAYAQQLVYDLKQEWVEYNVTEKGFLPVNEHDHELKSISFPLTRSGIDKFYLSIYVPNQSYLFHGSNLVTSLNEGTNNLKIDSLKIALQDNSPFLTIYGSSLLPGLRTEIRAGKMQYSKDELDSPIKYTNEFSNFFYIAATLLIIIFVVLKVRFSELAEQYLLFQRAINTKTIDELIYKIQFLAFPNTFFLILISLTIGFGVISFMYYFPGQLSILNIKPGAISINSLLISWATVSFLIFILLIIKYLLTRLLSSIFDLRIANIHFASSLRLILMLSILVFCTTIVQFFLIGAIPVSVYWIIIMAGVGIMQLIVFFKLTLVSSHTLLYIIVYLCATEILPTVFLFKFFTI